jgi:hypothetical protein
LDSIAPLSTFGCNTILIRVFHGSPQSLSADAWTVPRPAHFPTESLFFISFQPVVARLYVYLTRLNRSVA